MTLSEAELGALRSRSCRETLVETSESRRHFLAGYKHGFVETQSLKNCRAKIYALILKLVELDLIPDTLAISCIDCVEGRRGMDQRGEGFDAGYVF